MFVGLGLALCVSLQACTTPRYVGEITRDGALLHRAFGLILDYADSDWSVIDPADPSSPPDRSPVFVRSALDLNADGVLDEDEASPRYEPLFALQSSTVLEAWASVRVVIVPKSAETRSTETFLRARFHHTTTEARATPGLPTPMLTQEGQLEQNGPEAIISVAEQAGFEAEDGLTRRQLVFVRTTAPTIDQRLRVRHLRLLEGLTLAPKAAPVRPGESYLESDSTSAPGSRR
ncbi:MAG: hypothetical protein AAGD10_09450 [Myxococcota bacterium]